MELKNGMKVIAPEGCKFYLTAGKEYIVFDVQPSIGFKYSFSIMADSGDKLFCLLNKCSHLHNQDWIVKNRVAAIKNLMKDSEELNLYENENK